MNKIIGSLSLFLLLTLSASAQQFYVVTGVFSKESNAQKFTGYMRASLYNASYALNTTNNYYYVYILKTDDHPAAVEKAKALQAKTEFKDAWVYSGTLGTGALQPEKQSHTVVSKTEITPPLVITPPVEEVPSPLPTDVPVPVRPQDSIASSSIPVTADDSAAVSSAVTSPDLKVKGKLFEFKVMTTEGKPVNTEVHYVDFKHSRDLASYKTNQYVDVVHSAKEDNVMTLVCGVFGYKEVVKVLDYSNPAASPGIMKDVKGAYVVPYTLERMKKGDISVMYHLSFYKDAVVMLPPSQTELDELVAMMTDNNAYKIKVHAHCNGSNDRRIIALGKTKNYFNINGSDEKNGTAKELTQLRGEAVQSYLTDHGIAKDRIDIYAWGALNMLAGETSKSAKLNDRIEIEIMHD